jgi:integrase
VGGKVYQESRTFGRKAVAEAWARDREDVLKLNPAAVVTQRVSVKTLIEDYLAQKGVVLGRSKASHLRLLMTFALAEEDAVGLTALQVVDHVRSRRAGGTGAATVLNDLIWLRVVWRFALVQQVPVRLAVLDEAMRYCKAEKLVAKPIKRVRRPTGEELRRIGAWFLARAARRARVPPMYHLLWAAIYSCRRQDELCRLRLADWDQARGTWLVRDVKHPSGSAGHHLEMVVTERLRPVLTALVAAFDRAPGDDRLVPLAAKSIGSYWTRQLRVLGIQDLHWHDLRHEGCSRLAEDGLTIPQIQAVSLHESWGSLQRYVHVPRRTAARVEWEDPNL